MARVKRTTNKGKKAKKAKIGKPRVRMPLDKPALDYAKLLYDPCSAPLTHPIYPGTDAGFLFRAESFVTLGNAATDTGGVIHWTPGYVNSSGTEMLYAGSAVSSANSTIVAISSNPGKSFLTSNARGARCVAACMKVIYPGSESSRSGRLHYGMTQAGMIDLSNILTVDNVAQTLQHYSRTPTDTVEVVWRPGDADVEFNDPTEAASAQIRDRKSSITAVWAGLPAGVGLTFHFTAVYEWTPAIGLGVGSNALGKARSANTLDNVVDFLISHGFRFVRHFGAAMGAGAVDRTLRVVQTAFGSMPAVPRTSSRYRVEL